jgi:hypothetical protein
MKVSLWQQRDVNHYAQFFLQTFFYDRLTNRQTKFHVKRREGILWNQPLAACLFLALNGYLVVLLNQVFDSHRLFNCIVNQSYIHTYILALTSKAYQTPQIFCRDIYILLKWFSYENVLSPSPDDLIVVRLRYKYS